MENFFFKSYQNISASKWWCKMFRDGLGRVSILILISLLLLQTAALACVEGKSVGRLQEGLASQTMIERTYDVRLITGDVVKVGLINKTLQVLAITPADPSELNKGYRIFRDERGLYVIPNSVDLRKFDIELFNVKYLVEEGYWNHSEIPVIISLKREGYPSVSSLIVGRGGRVSPAYKLIPASAATIPMSRARDVVGGLASNKYVEKVWLDKKVHIHLSESAPLIGAPYAWKLDYNGSGVKIAILDTGIDKNHEDFFFPNGTSKIRVEVDFTDDHDTFDHVGHGTHVASIAAGTGAKSIITPIISDFKQLSRPRNDEFVRASSNGTHVAIVWQSDYSGNWDVWFLLADARSQAPPPPPQQLTTDANPDMYPFVTFLRDGRILVLWTSNRTGDYQLWYKVYDKGIWGPDKQLAIGPGGYSPVTQLSNGSIAITYSSGRDVWFAILNLDSGNTLRLVGGRRLTSANSTMQLCSSSIIQSPDGRIWVFIYDLHNFNFDTNIGGVTQIYYNVSVDMGATWSGGLLASGSGFINPSATVLPEGTIMLVFEGDDLDRGIPYTIWYMVYWGNAWSQPRILTPGRYLAAPSIVYVADLGRLYVVAQNWVDPDLGNDIFILTIPIFRGVAPGATLWNVKVLNRYGWGYASWIIQGIEFAALGPDGRPNTGDEADIISMSLGAPEWGDGNDPLSLACDRAVDLGRIVVVAAGNTGPQYFTVGIPAASRKAITVGASTKWDEVAWFSSRGSTRDFRIKPDVVAPGYEIWAALAMDSEIYRWAESGWIPAIDVDGDGVYDYVQLSGTSMATPHVAGATAIIKQARGFDPDTIKNVLISTSINLGYDVYTQGGGRINIPAAIGTQLIPYPATLSLGRVAGGIYEFNIVFRNIGGGWINITLSPSLKEVFQGHDASDKVSLNTTRLEIPAKGQKAVKVTVDTTSLPPGLYSGIIVTDYAVGGSNIHVIFGFSRMNIVHVEFRGLDGSPLSYAFVGAFKAYPSCEEIRMGMAGWTWGFTDENGRIDLPLLSGIYYIIGADSYKRYYADAYAVSKVNVTGDMGVMLDLRRAHKLSYSPPGHVIASLSNGLFYFYVNRECMLSILYGIGHWWYYPFVTTVYVTETDLTLGLYYQHYDKRYINVVDPETLLSPELYAVAFSRVNVKGDEVLAFNKVNLAKVVKEYRVALTPLIAAWMYKSYVLILPEQGPGGYWSIWLPMPGLQWKINSPRQIAEYITPGIYWTGYDKMRDQPNVITPYFSYSGEEGYPAPGTYSMSSNAHPLHPVLELGVHEDYLYLWGFFGSLYLNALKKGGIYYKYERLNTAPLELIVKRNGIVIYNGSGWGSIWTSLNISPPAEIEIDMRGWSLMSLSEYTHMNVRFNVLKGESWWRRITITPYIEGLDANNSCPPGDVKGHLLSGPISPFNVKSLEYSLDDGGTWITVRTQLTKISTPSGPILDYRFILKKVPEDRYISLRASLADEKISLSYMVIRGFYVKPRTSSSSYREASRSISTSIWPDNIMGIIHSSNPIPAYADEKAGAEAYPERLEGPKAETHIQAPATIYTDDSTWSGWRLWAAITQENHIKTPPQVAIKIRSNVNIRPI
jgi:subtilisin family serine protease